MSDETPTFSNVRIAYTEGVSASQLGVLLARDAAKEDNPIADALVVVRFESGHIFCLNSNMENGQALELASYAQADVMQQILADNIGDPEMI